MRSLEFTGKVRVVNDAYNSFTPEAHILEVTERRSWLFFWKVKEVVQYWCKLNMQGKPIVHLGASNAAILSGYYIPKRFDNLNEARLFLHWALKKEGWAVPDIEDLTLS